MGTCLVTTLKDAVTDTELLKLGEMKFHFKTGNVINSGLVISHPVTFTIKGDGYFTNSTGTSNLGKTLTLSSTSPSNPHIYYSAGDYDVVVTDKYNFIQLGLAQYDANYLSLDLSSLQGMSNLTVVFVSGNDVSGNLEDIKYLLSLERLYINYSKVEGDISALKLESMIELALVGSNKITGKITGNIASLSRATNLTRINLDYCPKVSGDVSVFSGNTTIEVITLNNTSVTGSLAAFSGTSALTDLYLQNTSISGNISSLSTLSNLRNLKLDGTQVTGATSSLASLTNLTTFTYTNTAITGTWPLV